MEKIYYENPYEKEFIAKIEDIKEIGGKFHVVLDRTAFFPSGGGQSADRGNIDSHAVIDVYEEEGIIYHVTDKKPIKINRVKCQINWSRRFDGMQQHSAQHVLSGCFYTLLNANTTAIHIGEEISTIDIEGILTDDDIRKVERYANTIIQDAIEIEALTPSKKELKKLKIRRALPNTNEDIRILKIGDLDMNACCGVHVKSTMDLRFIKIKKFEKYKGNTRIEYLAGERATNDALTRDEFARKILKYLNASEIDALEKMEALSSKINDLKSQLVIYKEQTSKYEVEKMIESAKVVSGKYVVSNIFDNMDLKYVTKLASSITETDDKIAFLALRNDGKINMVFAASKNITNINIGSILKDTITLVDGKGGGSAYLAQGAGKDNGNLENALNYAISKLQ